MIFLNCSSSKEVSLMANCISSFLAKLTHVAVKYGHISLFDGIIILMFWFYNVFIIKLQ